MTEKLYKRLQRRGYLQREVERMVNQDRNTFASLLLGLGEADVLISGVTRPYSQTIRQIRRVLDARDGVTPFGIHVLVGKSHTIFMRSEEHTSELQSLMRISYAVFCLKKKTT